MVGSKDLRVATPPAWMIELDFDELSRVAEQVKLIDPGTVLPTGVIVGSAIMQKVSRVGDFFRWHLTSVERATDLRKPLRHPQPVWFKPF